MDIKISVLNNVFKLYEWMKGFCDNGDGDNCTLIEYIETNTGEILSSCRELRRNNHWEFVCINFVLCHKMYKILFGRHDKHIIEITLNNIKMGRTKMGLSPILTAQITYENNEKKDITDELSKFCGPNGDFYEYALFTMNNEYLLDYLSTPELKACRINYVDIEGNENIIE